tara:strand:- start:13992 stop:14699 length:708 start_codon:yes stop_codon:yes gene_type:complete
MEIATILFVISVGSFIQSSIGFGLAVVAAPILFLIDPLYVPAPITIAALILSLANSYRHWRSISFHGLRFAILGRIPGTVFGGLLLLWIDQQALALWIGLSVFVAVALSLSNIVFKANGRSFFCAGFLSGFMGTSTSIGGPPMALVMQHQENDFIRANLAAFFVLSCLMSLVMLSSIGHFRMEHIMISLPFIPATLAGHWLAMRTMHRISQQSLRRVSLGLCGLAGLAAIVPYWF